MFPTLTQVLVYDEDGDLAVMQAGSPINENVIASLSAFSGEQILLERSQIGFWGQGVEMAHSELKAW